MLCVERLHRARRVHPPKLHGAREIGQRPGAHHLDGPQDDLIGQRPASYLPVKREPTDGVDVGIN
eukprot:5367576-Lingulodinium_polyedra.AAC.1